MLSDIQKAGVYLHVVALGAVKERKGETDRDRGSGGVQGSFLCHCRKAKLLPDLRIHPCFFTSRLLLFLPSVFFLSLFWLLRQSVLLGSMAQGDNVCGEAVFEQDTSVSLAVQLSYETVPVDHKARTKPAVQNKRNKARLLLVHHRCHV